MNTVYILLALLIDPTQTPIKPMVVQPRYFKLEKNCKHQVDNFLDGAKNSTSKLMYAGQCVKLSLKSTKGYSVK